MSNHITVIFISLVGSQVVLPRDCHQPLKVWIFLARVKFSLLAPVLGCRFAAQFFCSVLSLPFASRPVLCHRPCDRVRRRRTLSLCQTRRAQSACRSTAGRKPQTFSNSRCLPDTSPYSLTFKPLSTRLLSPRVVSREDFLCESPWGPRVPSPFISNMHRHRSALAQGIDDDAKLENVHPSIIAMMVFKIRRASCAERCSQ